MWARSIGGSFNEGCYSVWVDKTGNIYTTGYFAGTADFDPGSGVMNLTSSGSSDIFVQKVDASGNFLWVKSMGGTGFDYGQSIRTDNLGNVYVMGVFSHVVDFDPGSGITNLTSSGNIDIFVQKLDSLGNFLWVKSIGGTFTDEGKSFSIDSLGNIYTTGNFRGTVDFNPNSATTSLTSAGGDDIFIQKLDTSGNFLWAKSIGSVSFDQGNANCVDAFGNIYTTGSYSGTVDFDPDTTTATLTSLVFDDVFVQKMDSSGNFVWVRSLGTTAGAGHAIGADNSGNVYTAGSFNGTADFDPGSGVANLTSNGFSDIFIQKMDSNGNFIWARSIGGNSSDRTRSISLDASSNIYITGGYRGTVDFDPGSGTANLTSAGVEDIFILNLDSLGNFIWVKSFGGTLNDIGESISTDASGNIYTVGNFRSTVDFDPNLGTSFLTSAGSDDIFIHKMSPMTTGLTTNKQNNSIPLVTYPNPTNGSVHIKFDQEINNLELVVLDITGKVVFKQSYIRLSNTSIELPSTSGIYFLNIKTDESQSIVKLIKE